MQKKRRAEGIAIAVAALVGLAGGAGFFWLQSKPVVPMEINEPLQPVSARVVEHGERRADFALNDLTGTKRPISEWDDYFLVVNFWATWCAPCLHEVPFFIEMQSRYAEDGVQFIGIAIDQVEPVRAFVEELGVNYPTLLGQLDALDVGKALGNQVGALPYTVFIDRNQRIVLQKSGAFERDEIDRALRDALSSQ